MSASSSTTRIRFFAAIVITPYSVPWHGLPARGHFKPAQVANLCYWAPTLSAHQFPDLGEQFGRVHRLFDVGLRLRHREVRDELPESRPGKIPRAAHAADKNGRDALEARVELEL